MEMIKLEKKVIVIFFLLVFILICCSKQIDKNINMQNKILCIEDINNVEGLYGGNFGDIVVYDADTFERFILTNDKYFDYSPTYSKKYNIIMFESLRNYQTYTGLTSQRDLLILNLNNFNINKFDTDKIFYKVNYLDTTKTYDGKLWANTDNYMPMFNSLGDKVIFYKYREGIKNIILLFDFNTETFSIVADSLIGHIDYIWSNCDSLIYYTKDFNRLINNKKPNEIRCYNVYTSKTKSMLKINNHYFYIYDELDKKILVKSYLIGDAIYKIAVFNLKTKNEIFSISTEELGVDEIYSPIFKDSNNIIFVGQINKDNYNQYLYNIKLDTKEIKKLSNNGGHKDCLSYIR